MMPSRKRCSRQQKAKSKILNENCNQFTMKLVKISSVILSFVADKELWAGTKEKNEGCWARAGDETEMLNSRSPVYSYFRGKEVKTTRSTGEDRGI